MSLKRRFCKNRFITFDLETLPNKPIIEVFQTLACYFAGCLLVFLCIYLCTIFFARQVLIRCYGLSFKSIANFYILVVQLQFLKIDIRWFERNPETVFYSGSNSCKIIASLWYNFVNYYLHIILSI